MLELYISCMNQLLQHQHDINNIVTAEQAGGINSEQLVINKTILEEVTKNHPSLVTMWFDYQKAFDSVLYKWLIKAFTAQKKKFSIKDFFSKCDQMRSFLRIWSHLLKKSVIENFIFYAVFKTRQST